MRLGERGLKEVVLLGRYNYARAQAPLPEHEHGSILEICFLVKGRQTYRVAGRTYHLRGGDVFVTFPNEKHGTAGHPEEKGVLYWMMLRRTRGRWLGLSAPDADVLWRSLAGLPARHFRGSARMKSQLDSVTDLFHRSPFPLQSTFLTTEVMGYLVEVIRCSEVGGRARQGTRMEMIYRYIQDHLDEKLSVPGLAERAGLSTARFKARFKEETGVPPGEYVLRAKIAEAQRRLKTGVGSVTDVACDLEFSSSQYFATVFKRYTGKTPSMLVGTRRKFRG